MLSIRSGPDSRHPERDVLAEQLQVAGLQGTAEGLDLIAGIVDVKLSLYIIPGCSQEFARVSPRAAPRALPICSSPVGLALTNSTWTLAAPQVGAAVAFS